MYKLEGKDIVISGWESGIADDPYEGIGNIQCANISSTPKEVAVNFSTTLNSYASLSSVTISSASTGGDFLTIASSPTLESGMAITISGSNLPNPITAGTSTGGAFYWVNKLSNTTMQLASSYPNYVNGSFIDITTTGTPGDWTFSTVDMKVPMSGTNQGGYWLVDSIGRVWNAQSVNSKWTYTGNKIPTSTYTSGNGIVYYQASDGTGYIFVIHNSSIDYSKTAIGTFAWNYQWTPGTNYVAPGTYAATPTAILKAPLGSPYSHDAIVTPANQAVFCDTTWIDRFYQVSPSTPFDPQTASTYTWDQTNLLPATDYAQSIAFLGQNIMVGGKLNVVYPWDGFSTKFLYPIFIAENNIVKMVTVNTNTFLFVGNRGRIYVTNGTNANLFKKIPDNISGTLEPYFTWRGASTQKNRLYFGFSVTKNDGTALASASYKGLWSLDIDSKALIQTNNLSGTNVYSNLIIPIPPDSSFPTGNGGQPGAGLYIGWTDSLTGTSTGVDITSSTPYSNSETFIETDMIPVGTYLNQFSPAQVEWKTSYPIGVNGTAETISIAYRTALNQSYATIGSTTVTGASLVTTQNGVTQATRTMATTSGTGTSQVAVSDMYQVNFQKAQWVQFKITMSANATTPTFNRLTEIRVRNFPN